MKFKHTLCTLFLLTYCASRSQAQTLDYKFQSVFLYHFAKYTEWPSDHRSGDITIGIVDNAKVSREIESFFSGKTINSRKVVIKNFTAIDQISYCNILFLPAGNKNNLAQVLQKVGLQPTLVVTEKEGWGKQGSVINFIISEEGKFMFELNQAAAQKYKLKIASEITGKAILM